MPDFYRNVYCLAGLPFDAVSLDQAERQVRSTMADKRRCFLSTPNLNFLVASQTDRAFRDSVIQSDLVVADGMPIVWLSKLLCIPIRERVAGSDLFDALRLPGHAQQVKVFFFGGTEGVADLACNVINEECGGVKCVGSIYPGHGSVSDMSMPTFIQRINNSQADFLVVALGARKGQEWILHNLHHLHVPLVSHLGAVVNFVAGRIQRAPNVVRTGGFEWLWRIKEEPSLWRRYYCDGIGLAKIVVSMVLPLMARRFVDKFSFGKVSPATIQFNEDADVYYLVLEGGWNASNIEPLRNVFTKIANGVPRDICLNLSHVTDIDSAFVGLLLLLKGYQNESHRAFRIEGISRRVSRRLNLFGAIYLV